MCLDIVLKVIYIWYYGMPHTSRRARLLVVRHASNTFQFRWIRFSRPFLVNVLSLLMYLADPYPLARQLAIYQDSQM
jgi:hypothetical protein